MGQLHVAAAWYGGANEVLPAVIVVEGSSGSAKRFLRLVNFLGFDRPFSFFFYYAGANYDIIRFSIFSYY